MNRIEALRGVLEATSESPVVAMCAATSRELAHLADRPNHLYLLDSMGLTTSVALGLALALDHSPVDRVVAIEGDGSLLMNMGSLATIGYLQPQRLVVVLLDNASYASTGGLPTQALDIDLGAVAAACQLQVSRADDMDGLKDSLANAYSSTGPHLIHVKIDAGNEPNVALLLSDPTAIRWRFESWLSAVVQGQSRPADD